MCQPENNCDSQRSSSTNKRRSRVQRNIDSSAEKEKSIKEQNESELKSYEISGNDEK